MYIFIYSVIQTTCPFCTRLKSVWEHWIPICRQNLSHPYTGCRCGFLWSRPPLQSRCDHLRRFVHHWTIIKMKSESTGSLSIHKRQRQRAKPTSLNLIKTHWSQNTNVPLWTSQKLILTFWPQPFLPEYIKLYNFIPILCAADNWKNETTLYQVFLCLFFLNDSNKHASFYTKQSETF